MLTLGFMMTRLLQFLMGGLTSVSGVVPIHQQLHLEVFLVTENESVQIIHQVEFPFAGWSDI